VPRESERCLLTGRERKKQETRRRLADLATALFIERGFDTVSVAEVAEAAGVSKVTVFDEQRAWTAKCFAAIPEPSPRAQVTRP
jgi:2-methylcitrate dehydratase PrpD